MTSHKLEIGATKDPSKKLKIVYSEELIQDLVKIGELDKPDDADEQMKKIFQQIADKEYDRYYGTFWRRLKTNMKDGWEKMRRWWA